MEPNPYSAPQSSSEEPTKPISRKRWVAVVLALVTPPIAMLYLARPRRAVAYFAAAALGPSAAMLVGAIGAGDLVLIFIVFSFLVPPIAAVDAFRLARAWNRATLPWYSTAPALTAFFAAGWLAILSLRGFVVEPFKIASASMEPTLKVGDQILVSKSSYGWNVPLTGRRVVRFAVPGRGDVALFRYPGDRNMDYVMRVIGLPGDQIAYLDKQLKVNGKEAATREMGSDLVPNRQGESYTLRRYREALDKVVHSILIDPDAPTYQPAAVRPFHLRENCEYREAGFVCNVPDGHYFVMGDNRDRSSDSRYWGFVPEGDFVGRVFVVWYSTRDPGRAGTEVE